jgi:carbamoyl-phosphate synthase large subunit
MTSVTVLISSAGRRVELLKAFRSALLDLSLDGRVLAADRSARSSAFHSADEAFLVPSCDDAEFLPAVLNLCDKQAVDLLIPTIDPELPVYAAARADFAAAGTTVAISAPEVVEIAADKGLTHGWLTAHGFATVDQATVDEVRGAPANWVYPLVVKPRRGSAGIGVTVVQDQHELALAARSGDAIVETVAPGQEYTIDALVDRSGRCICAVPRRRLEVRAGEVSKAVTVRSRELEALVVRLCNSLPGAYGPLTVQVFHDDETGRDIVIELNARFGGGYPLARQAGADYPRWLLEEAAGLPSTASADGWRDGLVMLRYDAAVFVDRREADC